MDWNDLRSCPVRVSFKIVRQPDQNTRSIKRCICKWNLLYEEIYFCSPTPTVHFIFCWPCILLWFLVNDQLDAQFFSMCLFQFSTCFEKPRGHHQENQLYQYIWYMSLCVGKFLSDLHTKRSPTQSDIYLMLYWYNWFSWWWARGCSKHVENWNKHIEKNCTSSWSFTKNLSACSHSLCITVQIRYTFFVLGLRGGAVGWGPALQDGRSRARFPTGSLKFLINLILPDEGVDSASNRYEYQGNLLGV